MTIRQKRRPHLQPRHESPKSSADWTNSQALNLPLLYLKVATQQSSTLAKLVTVVNLVFAGASAESSRLSWFFLESCVV